MKLHDYEPKMFVNRLLILAAALMTGGVAALWIFRETLMLSTPRIITLTGLDLLVILLAVKDHLNKKDFYNNAKELKKQRDEMSNEDFKDNSIFYRDE